ncbi:hypothetical protein A2U01_0066673, partial [Trifolium medium]|nr:hypothetical protein [Trifolium medium]
CVSGIGVQGSPSICSLAGGLRRPSGTGGLEGSSLVPCRSKRTKSCPPGGNRSMLSGP